MKRYKPFTKEWAIQLRDASLKLHNELNKVKVKRK